MPVLPPQREKAQEERRIPAIKYRFRSRNLPTFVPDSAL
jgi:hypothetical protein